MESLACTALPSLNKTLVLEVARCEYVAPRERHRARQQRPQQDPHRARAGSGRPPEGPAGRILNPARVRRYRREAHTIGQSSTISILSDPLRYFGFGSDSLG